MTIIQQKSIDAKAAELAGLGGTVHVGGGDPSPAGLSADLSALDTHWAAVVLEDLESLIVVTKALEDENQYPPNGLAHGSKPIVNITIDGKGIPTVGVRWTK